MPFSSAAPVEYLKYLPDSPQFRSNTIADGPYQISKYVLGKEIDMVRNPAWKQASDPIRHAYVDTITTTIGLQDEAIQQQLEAGTADWGIYTVPTARLAQLLATNNTQLGLYPTGSTQYVVDQRAEPEPSSALQEAHGPAGDELRDEQAAIIQIAGGPKVGASRISTILTPTSSRATRRPTSTPARTPRVTGEGEAAAGAGWLPERADPDLPVPQPGQRAEVRDVVAGGPREGWDQAEPEGRPAVGLLHEVPAGAGGGQGGCLGHGLPGLVPGLAGQRGADVLHPAARRPAVRPRVDELRQLQRPADQQPDRQGTVGTSLDERPGNFWQQADPARCPRLRGCRSSPRTCRCTSPTTTQGFQYFAFAEGPDVTNVWIKK